MVGGRRTGRRAVLGAGLLGAVGAVAGVVGWRSQRRGERATLPWIRSLRTVGGEGRRGGIVVVGDSLTYERLDDLVTLLRAAGYGPIRADGRPGRRCAVDVAMAGSGVSVVRDARAAGVPPSVWLVALGQNDADQVADAADAERAVAGVLDAIGTELTIWVDTWNAAVAERWRVVNAGIDAAAAARPHVRVARWSALASAHPEWFTPDGIHNTPEGAAARNRFLVDSVTV